MIKRTLKSPNFWIALVLLVTNGMAWVYALAPEGPAVMVAPRLEPDITELRQRLVEGGHSGEPFHMEITDREAAETLAWYLDEHPEVPFHEPQVSITPGGITAGGVAEIAGFRVKVAGGVQIELNDGVPIVTVKDLHVAGVGVPGFVRDRIQAELDGQFSAAQNLPLVIEDIELEEGQGTVRGTIR